MCAPEAGIVAFVTTGTKGDETHARLQLTLVVQRMRLAGVRFLLLAPFVVLLLCNNAMAYLNAEQFNISRNSCCLSWLAFSTHRLRQFSAGGVGWSRVVGAALTVSEAASGRWAYDGCRHVCSLA
eukprot:1728608-Amphidinium_carterae.1